MKCNNCDYGYLSLFREVKNLFIFRIENEEFQQGAWDGGCSDEKYYMLFKISNL